MKLAFVTPWYGEKIPGGAEAELRGIIHHIQSNTIEIEVLTTCIYSFNDNWDTNRYMEGEYIESGIKVRRFSVDKRRKKPIERIIKKIQQKEYVTKKEETIFCERMILSPSLIEYIKMHEKEFDLFVYLPYMFSTTYIGCKLFPEKSIMIPCLHDENYAYLHSFMEVYSGIKGMIFNSEPERILARNLFGVKGDSFKTIGIGIEQSWEGNSKRFREKYGIWDPFILYAGRKDLGKNVEQLVAYFTSYKRRCPGRLKLVLIGGGDLSSKDHNKNVIDLGYVDMQDKYDAYSASLLFCNPSYMESFSLVLMESWLAGRPVLVNANCSVTKDFTIRSNGGLYYDGYAEFVQCVNYMINNPNKANQMGEKGRKFVKENYNWNVITKKLTDYFMQQV